MLKSKTNKVGAMALATMMAAGAFMAGGTAVHAAAPTDGTTPVSYENRVTLPDGNAQYGVVIPTAISFTDTSKVVNPELEITGINGYDIDRDWSALTVSTKIKSTNEYKLKDGAKEVEYKVEIGGFDSSSLTGSQPTEANPLTTKLGIGTGHVKKVTGTATLTGTATAKGQYKDTLTFSFTEDVNTPN